MKKKQVIIIAAVILILAAVVSVGAFIFIQNDEDNEKTSNNTNSEQASTQDDEDSEEDGLPVYVNNENISPSDEAFSEVWAVAQNWASDARFQKAQGLPYSYEIEEEPTVYYGFDAGSFKQWSVDIYSPSKHEVKILSFSNGQVEDTGEVISTQTDYGDFQEQLPYYDNVPGFASSTTVYENLIANGANEEEFVYHFRVGESSPSSKYDGQNVWVVTEKSKTEFEEYDGGYRIEKEVANYYFDLYTGEFLEKVSL